MPDKCGPRTTTSSKLYFTPVASLKVVQMERLFSFFFFLFTLLPVRSLPGLCNISAGIFVLHEVGKP